MAPSFTSSNLVSWRWSIWGVASRVVGAGLVGRSTGRPWASPSARRLRTALLLVGLAACALRPGSDLLNEPKAVRRGEDKARAEAGPAPVGTYSSSRGPPSAFGPFLGLAADRALRCAPHFGIFLEIMLRVLAALAMRIES